MRFQIRTLTLICKQSREIIQFSPQVSFFHGKISAGKSSIVRLVDFCLGGNLERTTAIESEMVSAQLDCLIGNHEVVFEREKGSNQVQVTWRDKDGKTATALAPLQARPNTPIWTDSIYNLSDLLFYLAGVSPIKVRRSKLDDDSALVRLSFRDLAWYCFLQQEKIDSSFFNLDVPGIIQNKSRDVMRFIVGYYTEKLNNLEVALETARVGRAGKLEAARQVRSFLDTAGFGTEAQVETEIKRENEKLIAVQSKLAEIRASKSAGTHVVDELQVRLREMASQLVKEQEALQDLIDKIREQTSLRSELMSSKFKLARAESAITVLAGVSFDLCPSCGSSLSTQPAADDSCKLCKQHSSTAVPAGLPQAEIVRRDLTARIDELKESLDRHTRAKVFQEVLVQKLRVKKEGLDSKLQEEMKNYDSPFLAKSRELEAEVATRTERAANLGKTKKLFQSISTIETEADQLAADIERLKREIDEEKKGLGNADKHIAELEEEYLAALLAVGVPGVKKDDTVEMNRRTWIPEILPAGEQALRWSFENAGSGGKKTLLSACYILALHKVAARHRLPLPSFIMIDTPMKNIGEEVNRDIFIAFYRYLYGLAADSLAETQFILIDKEYVEPESPDLKIFDRFMTPDDPKHPPLISYYRGP